MKYLPFLKKSIQSSGYTLIELLVVISIIGILMSIATVSYTKVQQKGRDSKRQAQLHLMATSLDLFYADHGFYPITSGSGGINMWESAGWNAADHIYCLLGGTYNTALIRSENKDVNCGNTLTVPEGNLPANIYLGNGDRSQIPKDPARSDRDDTESFYAYVSNGQTYALATRHYEGDPPADHLFNGGEYWTALSPWEADLKNGKQYVMRSPNHR